MVDIDGICMMYRRAHSDRRIFAIIAEVHGLHVLKVKQILIDCRLMSPDGEYNAPARLTGKEKDMSRKINYPTFQWSPKRQKLLADLYQSGKPVTEIAEHFGVDENTIYNGIAKYNITCTQSAPPADVSSSAVSEQIEAGRESVLQVMPTAPDLSVSVNLSDLLHIVVDSANLNNDAMDALTSGNINQCCFELGQQCAMLTEATRLIRKIQDITPAITV